MDTNYLLFLVGVLIIIVSFGVILNLKSAKVSPSEKFETEQPLLSMNKCGREIVFPNFSSINLASQRAANDPDITRNVSHGNCNTPLNNEGTSKGSDTYSVIKDNYIFYSLKRTCIGMPYKSIAVNGNRVAITFNTQKRHKGDPNSILYFMLLNPLFVEFNFSSNKTTVAYYPVFHNNIGELNTDPRASAKEFRYSNYNKTINSKYQSIQAEENPTIYFDVVLPREDKGKDSLFNYFTNDSPYVYLNDLNYPPSGNISVQLYYLDDNIPTSYQNVGKTLTHPQGGNLMNVPYLFANYQANKTDLLVFNTDYVNKYSQNSAYKDIYEFNNNINVFYKNFIQPVFTISMDLQVTEKTKREIQNNNIVITRMFMDNNFGNYNSSTCNNITKELGSVTNNNIFMIVLELGNTNHNGYSLSLVLGRDGNCNYNIPFTDKSNVKIVLPFLKDTQKLRITVTLSPNEKIVTAFWKDPESYDPKVSISRSTYCGEDLNLHRLFRQKPRQATIGNIKMNADNAIVSNLNYIALGYKNLASEYTNYI